MRVPKRRERDLPNIFPNKIRVHSTSHLHSSSSGHCNYCGPSYFLCCSIYNYLLYRYITYNIRTPLLTFEMKTKETWNFNYLLRKKKKRRKETSTLREINAMWKINLNITLKGLPWAKDRGSGLNALVILKDCSVKLAAQDYHGCLEWSLCYQQSRVYNPRKISLFLLTICWSCLSDKALDLYPIVDWSCFSPLHFSRGQRPLTNAFYQVCYYFP